MSVSKALTSPLLLFGAFTVALLGLPLSVAHAGLVHQQSPWNSYGGYSYPVECYVMNSGDPSNWQNLPACPDISSNSPGALKAESSSNSVTTWLNSYYDLYGYAGLYSTWHPPLNANNPVSGGGTLTINPGEPVVLSWSLLPYMSTTERVGSNTYNWNVDIMPLGSQSANFGGFWAGYGQVTVYPTQDTTYSVYANNAYAENSNDDCLAESVNGSRWVCFQPFSTPVTLSVNVHINTTPNSMSIWTDSNLVGVGQSTDVHWRATGYSNCTAYRSNGQYWEVMNGDVNTGAMTQATDYDLYCWGTPGDDNTRVGPIRQTINVRPTSPGWVTAECTNNNTTVHLLWGTSNGDRYLTRLDYGPNNSADGWNINGDDWLNDNYPWNSADRSIHTGQAYRFWVMGSRDGNASDLVITDFTCGTVPVAPPPPATMTSSCSADATQVTISWPASVGASKYYPRLWVNTGVCPAGFTMYTDGHTCYNDNFNATSFTANITPGAAYGGWVLAGDPVDWNQYTRLPDFSCTAQTTQPNPPATATASCSISNVLSFSWTAPSSGPAATFYMPRVNSNGFTSSASCPSLLPLFATEGAWGTCYSDHFVGTSLSFTAPTATFGAWVYSANDTGTTWQIRSANSGAQFTCPAPTTCTVDPSSPQSQTLSCPAGEVGSITQTRTSVCPPAASSPTWSSWTTTNDTCQVCPAGQQPDNGSCICTNGAINPGGSCTTCAAGYELVTGQCVLIQGTIQSFTVTPPRVRSAESAILSWTTTNMQSNSCTISPTIGSVTPNNSRSVTADNSTTYTLSCTGVDNVVYTSTATVSVVPVIREI